MKKEISKANNFSRLKDRQGITLIALVITIVILLILAAVSIRLLTGSNIIDRANEAAEKNKIAQYLEELNVEKMNYMTNKSQNLNFDYKVKEFLQFAIDDKVIKEENVENFNSLDDNVQNTIVQIEKYQYLVEKENNGNIKITYKGKANPYNGKYITSSWSLYNITKIENIDWKSTFPLDDKPTAIGELTSNGKYGFKVYGSTLIPENQGVYSSSAEAYYPIDLSDCSSTEKYTIKVNATFSSEANNDFGWIAITDSEKVTQYVNSSTIKTDGNILYKFMKSGTVKATDYSYELTGGTKYYLHFGYRKDGSVDRGSDAIIINSIGINGILKIVQKVPKVTLSTDVNGAKIQYQVGDVPNEEKWIDGNEVLKTTDESGQERYLWYGDYVWGRITNDEYNGPATSLYINDGIAPTVETTISAYSTDSITVNVNAKDKEMGMPENPIYCYYIAKEGEEYNKSPQESNSNSYKFEGLEQDTNYKIKVTTKDKSNNEGKGEITQKTSLIPKPDSYIYVEAQWSNGEIKGARISKSSAAKVKDFNIQYQVNTVDGEWKNVNSGDIVTDVADGDTIFVRLIDNSGNASYQACSTTLIDETPPTIDLSYAGDSSISPNGGVAAFSYNLYDYESGINLKNCKWMVSTDYIDNKDSFTDEAKSFETEYGSASEIIYSSNYGYAQQIYISILAVDYNGNYTIQSLRYTLSMTEIAIGDTLDYFSDYGYSYSYTKSDGNLCTIMHHDEWNNWFMGVITDYNEVMESVEYALAIPIFGYNDGFRIENGDSIYSLSDFDYNDGYYYDLLGEAIRNLVKINDNEVYISDYHCFGLSLVATYEDETIDFQNLLSSEKYQAYYYISSGRRLLTNIEARPIQKDDGTYESRYYILENGILKLYTESEVEQMGDLMILAYGYTNNLELKTDMPGSHQFYLGNKPN